MSARIETVPLPLALHLASYTVIGLFCLLAGTMNLIDPGHIVRLGVPLLAVCGFSWGYVFGILMGRKEVLALGFVASAVYAAAGLWQFAADWRLGALLLAVGLYGMATLAYYRHQILA
jgi:hypothetical protein